MRRSYSTYLPVLPNLPAVLYSVPHPYPGRMPRGGRGGRVKSGEASDFGLAGLILGGGFIAERSFRQADRIRVNDRIRAREIRVVDEDGGQLGVMPPFEAIKLAREKGLDLVEISPTADPPVCKITDYGKYLYQTNKKAHEQRKHQKGSQLKEVKFRPATAEHDYQVRKNQIIRFLGEGHKVKAMIFHRGREMAHQEVGRAKMHRLLGGNRRTRAGGNRAAHGSQCFDGASGAEARRYALRPKPAGRSCRRTSLKAQRKTRSLKPVLRKRISERKRSWQKR